MTERLKFLPINAEDGTESDTGTAPRKAPGRGFGGLLVQIRARRTTLLGTIGVVWAVLAGVTLVLPESYTAGSKILIDAPKNPNVGAAQSIAADSAMIENEIEIIGARSLAERIIGLLKLYTDPDLNPGLKAEGPDVTWGGNWVRRMIGRPTSAENKADPRHLDEIRVRIVDTFARRLEIARRGKSRVISISYTSSSPVRAATVANAVAEMYLSQRREASSLKSDLAARRMNERLSALKLRADASQRAFTTVDAGQRSVATAANRKKIDDLRAKIARSGSQRAALRTRLDRAESLLRARKPDKAASELSSNKLRKLRARIIRLRNQLADNANNSDSESPDQLALEKDLQQTAQRFRIEIDRRLQVLRNEINVSLAKENTLRYRLTRLEGATFEASQPDRARFSTLGHKASKARAEYEALASRFEAAIKRNVSLLPDARIISRADTPLTPSFPRVPSFLAFAFACACVAGLLMVAIAARFDRGFRSLEQIEQEAGVPALGLIPEVPSRLFSRKDPEEYMLEKPVSAFSEAVRSLHASVLLSNVASPPRLIMVTSTAPNEGKTSLALSFARMVGRIGQKRVVVVDCDLRHPQVDYKLRLNRAPGLVEYLLHEASLEEVLQVDEHTNALVIAAGRVPMNSVGLLTSDRFKDLLDKLAEACDLVILDSSPVLAVSDAKILAGLVDETIFVARWARTPRDMVMRAITEIRSAGSDIAGVVLSRVDVKRHARFGFSDSGVYHGAFRKYYSG